MEYESSPAKGRTTSQRSVATATHRRALHHELTTSVQVFFSADMVIASGFDFIPLQGGRCQLLHHDLRGLSNFWRRRMAMRCDTAAGRTAAGAAAGLTPARRADRRDGSGRS